MPCCLKRSARYSRVPLSKRLLAFNNNLEFATSLKIRDQTETASGVTFDMILKEPNVTCPDFRDGGGVDFRAVLFRLIAQETLRHTY